MSSSAERMKRMRERGRQVSTVLTDPTAIEAWDELVAACGSQAKAIETLMLARPWIALGLQAAGALMRDQPPDAAAPPSPPSTGQTPGVALDPRQSP